MATIPVDAVHLQSGHLGDFPMVEHAFTLGATTCTVHVHADATGKPDTVDRADESACPDLFFDATRAQVQAVVFDPKWLGKNAADGAFDLQIAYTPPLLVHREDRTVPIEDAVAASPPPEKVYDKKPFLPRGEKFARCSIEIYVDAKGEPYALDLRACPEHVELAAESALLEWRYQAPMVDGKPHAVHFPVMVNFSPP